MMHGRKVFIDTPANLRYQCGIFQRGRDKEIPIRHAVVAHLPADLFPGGAKAAWWAKMVQLDMEAKGVVDREQTKPLRWHLRAKKRKSM